MTPQTTQTTRGLDPTAHALTVFRILPSGEGREYTATTFPRDPWAGCEHFIRIARKVGWLSPAGESYAVLDVLNAEGNIVQDFGIRDARAFQQIKRRLNLQVAATDGE